MKKLNNSIVPNLYLALPCLDMNKYILRTDISDSWIGVILC
jgi:hypothetical protein